MNTPAQTMQHFFTRQKANEGVKLPLDLPDGTPTAHFITVRGVDSDDFRRANTESKRKLVELALDRERATLDPKEHEQQRLNVLASLVAGWSFDQPCTFENIITLLREAPNLADQIDRIAAKRHLFFLNGSTNSSPSLPQNSS